MVMHVFIGKVLKNEHMYQGKSTVFDTYFAPYINEGSAQKDSFFKHQWHKVCLQIVESTIKLKTKISKNDQ